MTDAPRAFRRLFPDVHDSRPVLLLLDLDDTLIRGHLEDGRAVRDYDDVTVLAGRRLLLDDLRLLRVQVAIVTNQAGVAFGYQSEDQVQRKLIGAFDALGLRPPGAYGCRIRRQAGPPRMASDFYVSLGHPEATDVRYRTHELDDWRKGPERGGMLVQAMRDHQIGPQRTTMVGDRPEDAQAAVAAGVRFVDVTDVPWEG